MSRVLLLLVAAVEHTWWLAGAAASFESIAACVADLVLDGGIILG